MVIGLSVSWSRNLPPLRLKARAHSIPFFARVPIKTADFGRREACERLQQIPAWPFHDYLNIKSVDLDSLSGEQGWRTGESARLPPLWPGFDSRTRRHMWVEFVVGSRHCSEGFSPDSQVFLPPQKINISKF